MATVSVTKVSNPERPPATWIDAARDHAANVSNDPAVLDRIVDELAEVYLRLHRHIYMTAGDGQRVYVFVEVSPREEHRVGFDLLYWPHEEAAVDERLDDDQYMAELEAAFRETLKPHLGSGTVGGPCHCTQQEDGHDRCWIFEGV